jgi:hypothetical protein
MSSAEQRAVLKFNRESHRVSAAAIRQNPYLWQAYLRSCRMRRYCRRHKQPTRYLYVWKGRRGKFVPRRKIQ